MAFRYMKSDKDSDNGEHIIPGVIKVREQGECLCCGAETYYVDLYSECYFCSEWCLEHFEATIYGEYLEEEDINE